MKEVRNKRLVLAGLVVLALLLAGTAAIAIFRETLTATIRAQTGTLVIRFVDTPSAQDDEPANLDIGSCTASFTSDFKNLSVQIQNAYPRYNCTVTAKVRNTGTIDAKFEGFDITGNTDALLVHEVQPAPGALIARNGGEVTVSFRVTVKDNVAQNAQYNVNLTLKFRQALP